MIAIYKMGMSYYNKSKVDKNSGLTEVELIAGKTKNIKTDKKVLIIINGVRDEEDEKLFELIKGFDVSIFIMSDSIAIKTSLDIMNACDFVLHQAPGYKFSEITTRQTYSFVPELFYEHCKEMNINVLNKSSKVYFGGNDTGREDKFEAYNILSNDDLYFKRCKLASKNVDERISHEEYLKEISSYKYSLVICRDDYRGNGWLTSRFFEAVALGNLPIMDIDYDCNNILIPVELSNIYKKVKNEKQLMEAVEYYENNKEAAARILYKLNLLIQRRVNRFEERLEEVIG